MTGGATQVQKSSFGQHNDTVSVWELVSMNLWFDLNLLDSWVGFKTVNIDLIIEMTNVSNDSVVLHLSHMMLHDDALVSSGGNKDISSCNNILHLLDDVSFHGSLECANWIDLSNDNSGTACFHGLGATFADITETTDDNFFTGDHDISGSHEAIW